MIAFLTAAAMVALNGTAQPAEPALPNAKPAIWVVNDEDTTIYLFGTFHALDGRTSWFNDEIATAFAHSDELVLETLVPDPDDFGARAVTQPPSAFAAPARPMVVDTRSSGLRVDKGADAVLRRAAEITGKAVDGLESFESQLNMFAALPKPGSRQSAPADPRARAAVTTAMQQMQAAWNNGDQSVFATLLDHMKAGSPSSYSMMFVERNRNWADWIAQRLQRPGTVFVAVGTGHLVGPDSVQARLAERHIRSARIN